MNKKAVAANLVNLVSFVIFVSLVSLFLFSALASGQEPSFRLKVVSDLANIRQKPDIVSPLLYQAPKNSILEATVKEGEWYRVSFKIEEEKVITGYVHQSLVLELDRPPQKKKEEPKEREEKPKKERVEPVKVITPAREKEEPGEPLFSVSFKAGVAAVAGGDLNQGSRGLADYYTALQGIPAKGEVTPVSLAYLLGGDLSFPLAPDFSLGLGLEYFRAERESRLEFLKPPSSNILTTRPSLRDIPLQVFLSYSPSPLPFFYTRLGVEYHLVRCGYNYRIQQGDFRQEWQGQAKAQGFGLVGSLGLLRDIQSQISLFIEVAGRYARIKGFKGTNYFNDSAGLSSSEEGLLYIYEAQISGQKSHSLLFVRNKKPTEAGVSNPREASVDLSGLSLRAGLRIHF